MNSPRLWRLALCACSVSLLISGFIASVAHAGTVPANVRVITDTGKSLVDVRQYTDTTSIPTSPQATCFGPPGGSGKLTTVYGATAIGATSDAAASVPELNPLLVTDQFSFGPGVCGFGGVSAAADFSNYWELRIDHKYAQLGGNTQISQGDDILWTLVPADFDSMGNPITKPELALVAPARTTPGVPLMVTVYEYNARLGDLRPAAGVSVTGAASPTDAAGHAAVSLPATSRIGATRSGAIASRSLGVCVNAKLKRCAPKRGLPIFGSNLADRIRGTLGNDTIKARGGDDKISARGRGRDTVQCGAGADTVKADVTDRVDKASCEKIDRPGGGRGDKR